MYAHAELHDQPHDYAHDHVRVAIAIAIAIVVVAIAIAIVVVAIAIAIVVATAFRRRGRRRRRRRGRRRRQLRPSVMHACRRPIIAILSFIVIRSHFASIRVVSHPSFSAGGNGQTAAGRH